MRNGPGIFLVSLSMMGCHAKLQHSAPHLGPIKPIVSTKGASWVHLGTAPDESGVVGDVIALIQVPKAMKISQQIDHALNNEHHEHHEQVLQNSLQLTLRENEPFSIANVEQPVVTLEVDVLSYGLHVDSIGQAGVFTYKTRARMIDAQGQKLYQRRHLCTASLRETIDTQRPQGPVNHAREFERLSDAEISAIYNDMARACGEQIVQKMTQHARTKRSE